MKKFFLCTIALSITVNIFANMASPILPGTLSGTVFTSDYVDILKEDLRIQINPNTHRALINVSYHIRSDSAGKQIPLLFHAINYDGNFQLSVDGVPVKILPIPEDYLLMPGRPMDGFTGAFIQDSESIIPSVKIFWEKDIEKTYSLTELQYVEVDWTEGEHLITVSYEAEPWIDRSDWVRVYNYRYSLSPAKYWRSFGTLNVEISVKDFKALIETNLGEPQSGDWDNGMVWTFDTLPTDAILITIIPNISRVASTFISIGTDGIFYIASFFLFVLHVCLIYRERKTNLQKRISKMVWIGALLFPLLAIIALNYSYSFIDNIIGTHASRFHGYYFLSVILYPIIVPFYGLFMWLLDFVIKHHLKNRKQPI